MVWVNAVGYANTTSGYTYETATVKEVAFKSAGTYTFYLQGNEYSGNDAAASVFPAGTQWLTATYYPRSYGTISTVASSPDGFEDAQAVSVKDEMTGRETVAYQVDLRELELKAARAKAEAERAQRELLEARLKSGPSPIRSTREEK